METEGNFDEAVGNNSLKIILAGHSLGGYIVGNFALKYPEGIKKILLLSPVGYRPMNE
jgi:abhydrolase domain-containing protein 6